MRTPLWLVCSVACATGGSDADTDDEDTPPTTDSTPPSPPTDTDEPPVVADVSVTLALHDVIGSIVVASWDQPYAATAHVEYSFDTDVWVSSPALAVDAADLRDRVDVAADLERDVEPGRRLDLRRVVRAAGERGVLDHRHLDGGRRDRGGRLVAAGDREEREGEEGTHGGHPRRGRSGTLSAA